MHFEIELFLELRRRSLYAWVHFYDKRLGNITSSLRPEAHGVFARQRGWTERIPWRTMRNRSNRIFVFSRSRRRVAQVPYPAMHPRIGRKRSCRLQPVERNQSFFAFCLSL